MLCSTTLCLSRIVSHECICLHGYLRGQRHNGSVYVGRSEDYGPDYVKQYRIVPAADHDAGEMFEDDYGFSVAEIDKDVAGYMFRIAVKRFLSLF